MHFRFGKIEQFIFITVPEWKIPKNVSNLFFLNIQL